MAEPRFDTQHQFDRVKALLLPGESLQAVWDCKGGGTGFVGVTDQRIVFYDQGLVMKKKSVVSIPFNRVIGVAAADGGGMFFKTTELTVLTSAGNFTFEFRGDDKAHWTSQYILSQIMGSATPQLPG